MNKLLEVARSATFSGRPGSAPAVQQDGLGEVGPLEGPGFSMEAGTVFNTKIVDSDAFAEQDRSVNYIGVLAAVASRLFPLASKHTVVLLQVLPQQSRVRRVLSVAQAGGDLQSAPATPRGAAALGQSWQPATGKSLEHPFLFAKSPMHCACMMGFFLLCAGLGGCS